MKNFLLLLFMIITTLVNAQTVFKPTSLIIGKGSDVDMTYVVDRSGVNDPKLKWDGTTFKWYFSNDGTTFGEMVSKSYVDTAVAGATIPDADATTKGKIQLAGDLSGTAASPTVPGLALKAPLASPVFTGTPVAPTASAGTNNTQVATTAYVDGAVASATVPDADATTKGKIQLAGDLAGTAASPTVPGLALKAPLASPVLTGTPVAPTATAGTNTTQIATTAFVTGAVASATIPDADATTKGKVQLAGDLGGTAASPTVPGLALKAPLASPVFTGTPVAPTATAGTNTTQLATTAFVTGAVASATIPDADATTKGKIQLAGDLSGTAASPTVPGLALKAPIASPTLTGDPKVPTPTAGDSDTSIASTAFVANAITTATDPTKISGPASATDNAIVRFDGTTGKLAQDSVASLSDTGVLTAVAFSAPGTGTTSSFSGLQINNNQITSTSGSNLDLNTAGSTDSINLKRKVSFFGRKNHVAYNDPTVGSAQYLEDHTTAFVRLTGSGLISVKGLIAGNGGDLRTIVNETGADVVFLNESSAASSTQRINTGTGSNLRVKNNGSIQVMYDTVSSKWHVVSGASAAGAYSDPDIFYTQTFENVTTSDFAYLNGVTIDSGSQIHGINSAYIGHGISTFYIGESLNVDPKFRGRNLTMKLSGFSDASAGNVTVDVGCTTTTDVLSGYALGSLLVTSDEQYVYFDVPSTCTNLKYRVNGLSDSGKNTYIDDITFYTTKFKTPTSALVQEADSELRLTGAFTTAIATDTGYRFKTITAQSGDAITYTVGTSSVGDKFFINKDGIYHMYFSTDAAGGTGIRCFFTRNGVEVTSSVDWDAVGQVPSIAGTAKLKNGDWLQVRCDSNPTSVTDSAYASFGLTYQGSLKQVVVNKNQKIKIPSSVLRFGGVSIGRGSVHTYAVRFGEQNELRGDAFDINPLGVDTSYGTHVKMKKACKLDVNANVYSNVAAASCWITKNQAVVTTSPLESEIKGRRYATSADMPPIQASFDVVPNDIIRVVCDQTPTTTNGNLFNLYCQEQEVQVSVSNTLPQFTDTDSAVRVYTANGWGSSNTAIRRFTSVPTNIGTSITYVDDASLGASFTINESGEYKISYTDVMNVAASFGISKNSPAATLLGSLGTNDILSFVTTSGAGNLAVASWSGPLAKGDIIRPHAATASLASHANNVYSSFTISKTGKPNVTGVDVTPFIDLSQIGSKGHVGEVIFSVDPVAPLNFISALNSTIGLSSGDQYRALYEKIWAMAGVSTTAGDPFRISSAKGTTASADWFAGKTITIDFSTNEVFIRALAASGRNLGSYQSSAVPNINATWDSGSHHATSGSVSWVSGGGGPSGTGDAYWQRGNMTFSAAASSSVYQSVTEARPKNVALAMYIRYAGVEENALITTTQNFSSDTASFMYSSSYTLSTLNTAPVGTYITATFAASSLIPTQTTGTNRPTQTDVDFNVNGILMVAKNYAATPSTNTPSYFAIQIGKGFRGVDVKMYSQAAQASGSEIDYTINSVGTSTDYGVGVFYNAKTGVLILSSASFGGLTSKYVGIESSNNARTQGYMVINASKTPTLSGISFAAPRVAYLSDVKASGTAGGTLTGATWNTRVLNTEDDQSDFLTLSGNQFTLPTGEYIIEGTAPAYSVGNHKTRIRNITDATTAIVGISASSATASTIEESRFVGRFTITASKVFEVQHWVATTGTTNGAGIQTTSGENEVYSQLKITKVK